MTYAPAHRAFYDADSHIMELPDVLKRYADPDRRDQIPEVSDSASIVTDEEVAVIMGPGGRRSAAHVAALAPVRQYPAAAHLAAGRPRFGLCCERLHQSRVYLATNVSQFGQIVLTSFCINDLFTPAANRRGRKLGLSL